MPNTPTGLDGSGTINPRLLTLPAGQDAVPAAGPTTTQAHSEEEDLFRFAPGYGMNHGSPDPGFNAAQMPNLTTTAAANTVPATAAATNTAGMPPYLFGPYACHLPTFDVDKIADELYERDRKFPPPANDDVDEVKGNAEEYVKAVREAIASMPEAPTEYENAMCVQFVEKMMRIQDRDVVITQVAAMVVRSVIKLHEPSAEGESQAEGMVEGEDGEIGEGRVDVPKQPDVIGDHLRPDQIEDIQPQPQDYQLTATARLDKICNVLAQTKRVTFAIFCGRDPIAQLVAAPFKVQADKYVGLQ